MADKLSGAEIFKSPDHGIDEAGGERLFGQTPESGVEQASENSVEGAGEQAVEEPVLIKHSDFREKVVQVPAEPELSQTFEQATDKSEEAKVLEGLLEHGVDLSDLHDEYEQALDLSQDLSQK
jgi:hypothetical protein